MRWCGSGHSHQFPNRLVEPVVGSVSVHLRPKSLKILNSLSLFCSLCTPETAKSSILIRLLLWACHLWQGLVLLLVLDMTKFMVDRVQVLEAEEKVLKRRERF